MAHSYGLTCGSGGRECYRRSHVADRHTSDEPTTDLGGGVQLSSGVSPSSDDGSTSAIVGRNLGLKQSEDALGAIGGPCRDEAPVGFAERLGTSHP